MIKFLLFFEFNLSMSSVLFFIRPVLDIFYFLLAFSNSVYYTVHCRKITFYNPLLIIYTPLKRPMAPPSVFYYCFDPIPPFSTFIICSFIIKKSFMISSRFLHFSRIYFNHRKKNIQNQSNRRQEVILNKLFHNTCRELSRSATRHPPFSGAFP